VVVQGLEEMVVKNATGGWGRGRGVLPIGWVVGFSTGGLGVRGSVSMLLSPAEVLKNSNTLVMADGSSLANTTQPNSNQTQTSNKPRITKHT